MANLKQSPRTPQTPRGAKPKREVLEPGQVIISETARYTVVSLLGSGGFGDVYKVFKNESEDFYALKTEDYQVPERMKRLKMELEVMQKCAAAKRSHFVSLIDRGCSSKCKFIVMQMVGLTLDKVRATFHTQRFSKSTAHRICVQLLESVRDLHIIGYLHRDLKPSNFAIGLKAHEQATIYMLDFGIARPFRDKEGKLIVARNKVAFMGSPRFAPRAAHYQKDQSRKDDLESLLFVMADTFCEGYLPWKGQRDKMTVIQMKDNFMTERGTVVNDIFKQLPAEFVRLVRYVDKLSYETLPNYDFMISEMKNPVRNCDEPLDWMIGGALPEPQPIARTTAFAQRLPSSKRGPGTGCYTMSTAHASFQDSGRRRPANQKESPASKTQSDPSRGEALHRLIGRRPPLGQQAPSDDTQGLSPPLEDTQEDRPG